MWNILSPVNLRVKEEGHTEQWINEFEKLSWSLVLLHLCNKKKRDQSRQPWKGRGKNRSSCPPWSFALLLPASQTFSSILISTIPSDDWQVDEVHLKDGFRGQPGREHRIPDIPVIGGIITRWRCSHKAPRQDCTTLLGFHTTSFTLGSEYSLLNLKPQGKSATSACEIHRGWWEKNH